jgi:hypothetical protein
VKNEPTNVLEGAAGILETIEEIERLAVSAEDDLERSMSPVRRSLMKRFPVSFLILVTLGFASVTFAVEEILHRHSLFTENPFLVLLVGLLILVITGTAYKKR